MRFEHLGVAIACAILTTSCSWLFGTDDEREATLRVLSTPRVRIEPGSPTASDDLHAVIIEASEGPFGEEVTYTYAWRVGDEVRATGPTVPRALTGVGETWTLEVTPHAGEKYGSPGLASVLVGEPAAITAPMIHVEPAEPRTLDTLRVVIDVASSDPEAGAITYDYAWTVDDAPSVTTPTVSADSTTKGQTWRVTVTPRVGTRIGTPAHRAVVIENSPPVVQTVGLNRYRPIVTDSLKALPAGVHDPDGDSVSLTYRWLRNEVAPVGGVTTPVLEMSAHGYLPLDTVSVIVTPNDGEVDGPPARVSPVPIAARENGWRTLFPERRTFDSFWPPSPNTMLGLALDADDRRLLYLSNGALWEITLDEPRGYAELTPEGDGWWSFGRDGVIVQDPDRNRFFVVSDGYVERVELDRGAERVWRATTERVGEACRNPSVFFDDARNRLVLTQGNLDGVFVLPLDGDGTWQRLAIPDADVPTGIGSVWLHEPGADVAYLVGGAPEATREEFAIAWSGGRADVWAFDLVDHVFTHREDVTLPAAVVYASAAVDKVARRAYLLGGAASAEGELRTDDGMWYELEFTAWNDAVFTFDFATESFAVLPTSGVPFEARALGTAVWDEAGGRVLDMSGYREDGFTSDVFALSPEGTRSIVDAAGTHFPEPTCEPGYADMDRDELVLVGGERHGGVATSEVWVFSFDDNRFRRVEMTPDPVHGVPPAAAGMGRTMGRGDTRAHFVAPSHGDPLVYDIWALDALAWRWVKSSTSTVPRINPSHGHSVLHGGAMGASTLGDPWCETPPWDCAWAPVFISSAERPSPWAFVSLESGASTAVGEDASGAAVLHQGGGPATSASQWTRVDTGLAPGTERPPENVEEGTVVAYDAGYVVHSTPRPEIYRLRSGTGAWLWTLVPEERSSAAYREGVWRSHHAAIARPGGIAVFGGCDQDRDGVPLGDVAEFTLLPD